MTALSLMADERLACVPRCVQSDPDLWTSDNLLDRMKAAQLCGECPLLQECFEEAERLRLRPYDTREDRDSTFRPWGVWGGLMFQGSRKPPYRLRLPSTKRKS